MEYLEGGVFHILNRGVDKRRIFLEEKDYLRFMHNLKDFNSISPVLGAYQDRRKYLAIGKPNRLINEL